MAEKKEGFGVSPAQERGAGPPIVYETTDYRVLVGRLSSGPEGTAAEFLVRYIVQHKRHGVIYGSAAGEGQAISAAIQAQLELNRAHEIAREQELRGFRLAGEDDNQDGGPPNIPKFQ